MADFCPRSSASSNPVKPDGSPSKITTKVIVANHRHGQLWKKIGLVSSVAVMGGQPVLAQIDVPAGETVAPPVAVDVAPAPAAPVAPAVEEVAPPAAVPVVIAPEPAAPSFSNTAQPVAPTQVEIVIPEPAAAPAETPIESAPLEEATDVAGEPASAPASEPANEPTNASNPDAASELETETPSTVEEDSNTPVATPGVDVVKPNDVVPSAIPTAADLAAEFGDVFVDPTDFSVGATVSPDNPDAPEVVVSERSTGCEYTVEAKSLGNNCGTSNDKQPTVANVPAVPRGGLTIGPVNISRSGVRFSGSVAEVASRQYYNTVAKPLVDLQAGESFVFPLASPSPITSLFGWRWHPIHNDYRFHSGTDLGAPQGTPILATQSGQVSVADYLGGYGLTVILRHGDNTLESRYAHMSHILVQPGEWVEQGDVIGLVGSTGNSTGPHLHFELHQLTGQGWVTVSPNDVLSYALANLNNRVSGGPLQALNIVPKAQAAPAKAALPKAVKSETLVKDAPHFRPAQPHAQ